MLGGVPGQDLSSQASALWTAWTGFSTHSSLAQVSSQGRPALVVPSFVRTFAPPNPSLVSSCVITASPVASQAGLAINTAFPSVSGLIRQQPFVVGWDSHQFPQSWLARSRQESSWSSMTCYLRTLLNLSHNCYSMAA